MPTTAWRQPTRRSPLEHVHAALGAVWHDDGARWPRTYGDDAIEAAAITEAAGIADIGPTDTFVIRGPHTRAALRSVGVSAELGVVVAGKGQIEGWCLAEDEALLLLPGSPPAELGTDTMQLGADIRAIGAAVTDQSSGTSVFRIVGPAAPAILEEACAVDLSARAVDDGSIVQAAMTGVHVSLARQDHIDAPGYTLLTARDRAEYLWTSLHALGAAHGLMAVGNDAVGVLPFARAVEAS